MSNVLLARIHQGDRAALQEFISNLEAKLRRRIRMKLQQVDPAYDDDDVLASARRRLDHALVAGKLIRMQHGELAAYVQRAAARVALDANRAGRRRQLRERLAACNIRVGQAQTSERADPLVEASRILTNAEYAALHHWSRGQSHASIADSLNMPLSAYRSWWRRLLTRLGDSAA